MRMKKILYAAVTTAAVAAMCAGYGNMGVADASSMLFSDAEVVEDADVTLMSTDDYEYEILNENEKTAEITDYAGSDEDVEIPSEIDGYTVTSIADYAFYYDNDITSITIPDTVTNIDDLAIYRCGNLVSITVDESNKYYASQDGVLYNKGMWKLIQCPGGKEGEFEVPSSVESFGYYAFYYCDSLTGIVITNNDISSLNATMFRGCSSLKSITVENDIYYYSVDGVLYNRESSKLVCCPAGKTGEVEIPDGIRIIGDSAFWGCNLTSVIIPDTVEYIGNSAFCDCDSLTSIVIPDSVTDIGYDAFDSCESLVSVYISDSVTSIGDGAFEWCVNLTSITVDEGNTYYSSQDGVLYNKSKTELICCPGGKTGELEIPDGVTSIENSAFYVCYFLVSVYIPDGVTSIGDYAFGDCGSLVSVYIPDSVTSIGEFAFDWCESLTDIYYSGTEEQWDSITFGYAWNYDCPDDMVIHYASDSETEETNTYTGIQAADDGKSYYMVNGVKTSYTGIVKDTDGTGKWYYVKNGVFTSYNGIVKNTSGNGKWYYVKNGIYTSYNGIVKNTSGNGKWYYVKNGIYTSYNGIVKNSSGNGKWYYVKNGVFTSYNGIVKNSSGNGKWYYVKNGVFTSYNGIVKNTSGNGKWYYVKNGVFTSYNGIVKNTSGNGKWYYVKNGIFTSYTGIVKNTSGNGKWYYVKKGIFTSTTGLVKNSSGNGKWYYVKNGIFTTYTGKAKIAGSTSSKYYNVVKGLLSK